MKIRDFTEMYNLHDSLLECIEIDNTEKSIRLVVDFCFWQQSNYDDASAETGIVTILFTGVEKLVYSPVAINSDEIIGSTAIDNNTIRLEMVNDMTNACYTIEIQANDVSLSQQK